VASRTRPAFAIWITGLPASGKSTLTAAIKEQLLQHRVDVAVLESDELRKVFTPNAHYDSKERETFYRQLAYVGALLARHGVPVIFDATANRRTYRDLARHQIPRFMEIYVDVPIETCKARDPKGIYAKAMIGVATTVPGVQDAYEPPEKPDLILHGDREGPKEGAARVITKLIEIGYLSAEPNPGK
jgi:adenylylsulfate kinase